MTLVLTVYEALTLTQTLVHSRPCDAPVACTFEKGICKWANDRTRDTMDWILNSGSTPSQGTGPTNDHTLNSAKGRE